MDRKVRPCGKCRRNPDKPNDAGRCWAEHPCLENHDSKAPYYGGEAWSHFEPLPQPAPREGREGEGEAAIRIIRAKVEGGPRCPEGGELFHVCMNGVGDAVEAACVAIKEAENG